LAFLSQKYPDLTNLVAAWPHLPEPIKAAIRALLKSAASSC
jgi:hypothetical protein